MIALLNRIARIIFWVKAYWEKRYEVQEGQYEWFFGYAELRDQLLKHLPGLVEDGSLLHFCLCFLCSIISPNSYPDKTTKLAAQKARAEVKVLITGCGNSGALAWRFFVWSLFRTSAVISQISHSICTRMGSPTSSASIIRVITLNIIFVVSQTVFGFVCRCVYSKDECPYDVKKET